MVTVTLFMLILEIILPSDPDPDPFSGGGAAVRHRLLPVNVTVLIVDVTGADRLVTGARAGYGVHATQRWREGVAVGLTPAGTAALLGVTAREFVGGTVELADVLGRRRAAELAERVAGVPGGAARLGVVEERVGAWLAAAAGGRSGGGVAAAPDGPVARAWRRLQRPGPRIAVPALADRLGVSRRWLELRFQREIGLSPGRVARIARLQHALGRLARAAAGPVADPAFSPVSGSASDPAPHPATVGSRAAACSSGDQQASPSYTTSPSDRTDRSPLRPPHRTVMSLP